MDKKAPVKGKKAAAQAPATPQTPKSIAQQQSLRNFLIISVVIIVITVLVGGYAIYRLINMNIHKSLEVRAQDYFITATNKKLQKLAEAEPKLEELKKAEGTEPSSFDYVTKRVLPVTPDFQGVLTIFNTLEQQTLVSVESISKAGSTGSGATATTTSTASSAGGAQTSQVSLKVSGSQEQITTFLRAVERSARVMDFSSMKISGDKLSTTLTVSYDIYNLQKPSIESKTVPLNQYEQTKGGN